MFQRNNSGFLLRSIAGATTALAVCAIARTASAAVLYNRETQHYYEFVPGSLTWSEAKTKAEARSFEGRQGYLATITSAEENAFLVEKFMLPNFPTPTPTPTTPVWGWIGATDADREGEWKWATGPEAGMIFQTPNVSSSLSLEQSNTPAYTNWASGEPNNLGNEDYAHLDYRLNRPIGKWNDEKITTRIGYFVEYGGMESVPEPVPEPPATLGLLLLGAWGIRRCTSKKC